MANDAFYIIFGIVGSFFLFFAAILANSWVEETANSPAIPILILIGILLLLVLAIGAFFDIRKRVKGWNIDRKMENLQLRKREIELERKEQKIYKKRPMSNVEDMKPVRTYPKGYTQNKFNVFICHASEDKDDVATPLAIKLQEVGVSVWYDKFSLKWGDSLTRSINEGLQNSLFGIVILSENFFKKNWPQTELGALVSLANITGEKKYFHYYTISLTQKWSKSIQY